MKKYKVRDRRAGFNDKEAQVYGEELKEIKQTQNRLTAKIILNEAKKKTSPLHNYFDWNNQIAGERWRLQQARHMIANIVEVVVINGKPSEQRSFFNVSENGKEAIYVTVKEAVGIESYRQKILSDIINHLNNTTILMEMFKNNI